MTAIKACFKCEVEKPIFEFYKHPKMNDGHLGKCKSCTKKDSLKNRIKNIDKVRAYDRKRGSRQTREYHQLYKARFPAKYKAKTMINNFIRDGKIKRGEFCQVCGSDWKIEGHHCDYSKPLDVMWLCSPCHKQWHANNGEGLNGF